MLHVCLKNVTTQNNLVLCLKRKHEREISRVKRGKLRKRYLNFLIFLQANFSFFLKNLSEP